MFNVKIGIDLGTYKTVIWKEGKGIVLEEPTIVAMDAEKNVLAIGRAAKEMIGKNPDSVFLHRPIIDGVVSDYKITELMLSFFIGKVLGKFSMFRPEVTVSVPSSISTSERRAVEEALIKAGAKNVYIVRGTVLSAIGSGMSIQEPKGRMVVNIGAGTTDVAVISLGGVVCAKSIKCAGEKMDKSIIAMVKSNYNIVIGEKTAENIKKVIGSAELLEEMQSVMIKGRDYVDGIPKEIKINSDEVTEALRNDLREILKAIREVFSETPPEISADIFDSGILLSGGGAKLKKLDTFILKTLGVKAEMVDSPEYVVAEGLGVVMNHMELYKRSIFSKKSV